MTPSRICLFSFVLLFIGDDSARAELTVRTDFAGGSARLVTDIDQEKKIIRIRPGGTPSRGWPCWWSVRIEGLASGETASLEVFGSDEPARNNGKDTGKPLSPAWAMPARAAISGGPGGEWIQTELGTRAVNHISYPIVGVGRELEVAWGPPFTHRESNAMVHAAERARPGIASVFELAESREGLKIRGLRFCTGDARGKPAVWIQARQHAWESGSSWAAQGFVEWLVGDEPGAVKLRESAEVIVVPVMDVDRVNSGDGGKEAAPHDHNRDWSDTPHYPEVAAAQKRLRGFAAENRLAVFLDLHNPGPNDRRPFFFVGPPELLDEKALANRERFLSLTEREFSGPLALDPKPRVTGQSYHPLWRQMSGQWVTDHGNPHTMAACLEIPWNTPHSTIKGYREIGAQLGRAVAAFLEGE
jgi:hypothetical protein